MLHHRTTRIIYRVKLKKFVMQIITACVFRRTLNLNRILPLRYTQVRAATHSQRLLNKRNRLRANHNQYIDMLITHAHRQVSVTYILFLSEGTINRPSNVIMVQALLRKKNRCASSESCTNISIVDCLINFSCAVRRRINGCLHGQQTRCTISDCQLNARS
jgi:hypothetical protein